MAVLWGDNFENYGLSVSPMLNGIYAQASNYLGSTGSSISITDDPDPTAPADDKALFFSDPSGSVGPIMRFVFPSGGLTTVGVSFRIWMPFLPAGSSTLPYSILRDTSNNAQCGMYVNTDGSISLYTGGGKSTTGGAVPLATNRGTLIGTSTAPALVANAWNHVEYKITIDDAAGATEVRVNGVEVLGLTLSSVDTKGTANTTATQVIFGTSLESGGGSPGYCSFYMRDFIVWDTSGTVNNDFLGTLGVYTLLPDADDTLTWTPSTGSTGYDLVDEQTPDDADYVSAADPPPAPNVFTVSNLPPDIVTVKALIPVTRVKKIDGGDGNVQMGLKGTLVDLGADRPITTAFTYYWDVSELSPDTSVAWTPTEVNNVKFQIDRTV